METKAQKLKNKHHKKVREIINESQVEHTKHGNTSRGL